MNAVIAITAIPILLGVTPLSHGAGLTVVTLTGKCTKAKALGVSTNPSQCSNKLINSEHPDGRNGFTFVLTANDGSPAIVTFSGDGNSQVHKDKKNATHPVDRVIFNFNGGVDNFKAVGSCSFANLFQGKPINILCTAETTQGVFSGEFISNGVSPDIAEM